MADGSAHYLNYKTLKKQIKSAQRPIEPPHEESPDLTGLARFCCAKRVAFFYELDRNVESVDDFFTKKSSDMQRRLKLLIDKYGDSGNDQLDYHELEDLVMMFYEEAHIGWCVDGLEVTDAKTLGSCMKNATDNSGTPTSTNEASPKS